MSITLRRKMFKLGGETNTHGIGITSGLEYRRPGYNAGGQVEPQATFGVGNNANKMIGPDGKVREANVAFIPIAGGAILRSLAGGLGRLAPKFLREYSKKGPKISEFYKYGDDFAKLRSGAPLSVTGRLGGGARARALRAAQLATAPTGLGITGAGALSAALPDIPEELQEKMPLANLVQGARDVLLEPAANFNIPGALSYGLTGKSLTGLIEGDTAEKTVGSANDTAGGLNQKDISPAMETAQTQEEQFAKMKADADVRAEMYYAMLGGDGPNKVRALSDAFTNAGALYDEDKSQALAGFSQGITGELDRDEAVRDEARRLGLQEVVGLRDEERMDEKARKQMFEQAELSIVASPDLTPEQRSSALQGLRAYREGIVDILPTNDKGDEADTTRMAAGTVYYDPANLYGGMYVAKPTTPDAEVKSFTTLAEAQAHARS